MSSLTGLDFRQTPASKRSFCPLYCVVCWLDLSLGSLTQCRVSCRLCLLEMCSDSWYSAEHQFVPWQAGFSTFLCGGTA